MWFVEPLPLLARSDESKSPVSMLPLPSYQVSLDEWASEARHAANRLVALMLTWAGR